MIEVQKILLNRRSRIKSIYFESEAIKNAYFCHLKVKSPKPVPSQMLAFPFL